MEDFSFFVKNILGKEIDYEGEISLDEWKIKVHALYIDDVQKTLNPIIQNFSILSMQDISNLNEMNKRLIEIFELGLTIKVDYYH